MNKPPAVGEDPPTSTKIVITRWASTPFGIFGSLTLPDSAFACWTLEKPWRNNQQDVSCIPLGIYQARIGTFRGRYPNVELLDVPDRSAIEIHAANLESKLQGCIAVGMDLGWLNKCWALFSSQQAMTKLMRRIAKDKPLSVEIREETQIEIGDTKP